MSIFNNTNCDIFQAPTLNELLEGHLTRPSKNTDIVYRNIQLNKQTHKEENIFGRCDMNMIRTRIVDLQRKIQHHTNYISPMYEITPPYLNVKPYLDVEYYLQLGSDKYPTLQDIKNKRDSLKENLTKDIIRYIRVEHSIEINNDSIILVESLDQVSEDKSLYKISIHVVVNGYTDDLQVVGTPNTTDDTIYHTTISNGDIQKLICYPSSKDVKQFADGVDSEIYHCEYTGRSCIDKAVYSKNQNFRIPMSIKSYTDRRYLTDGILTNYSGLRGTKSDKNNTILRYLIGVYGDKPIKLLTSNLLETLKQSTNTNTYQLPSNNKSLPSENNKSLIKHEINDLSSYFLKIIHNDSRYKHINASSCIKTSETCYRLKTSNSICVDKVSHNSQTREHYINYNESKNVWYLRCSKCCINHTLVFVDLVEKQLQDKYNDKLITNTIRLEKLYSKNQYNKDDGYTDNQKQDVDKFHNLYDSGVQDKNTIILVTPMGTGKTTFISNKIKDKLGENSQARILIIVHRILLASDMCNKSLVALDFTNYTDIKDKNQYKEVNRLIIGIKSIKHLFTNDELVNKYDMIFIDEAVSCCRDIKDCIDVKNISTLLKSTNSPVICDALYSYKTESFFSSFLNTKPIFNNFKPRDLEIILHQQPLDFFTSIINNLKEGRKTCVMSTDPNICTRLGEQFSYEIHYRNGDIVKLPTLETITKNLFTTEDCFVSISGNDLQNKKTINSLAEKLKKVKLFCYTSVIEAGIDINEEFELPLYFIIKSNSVDTTSIKQFTGRIRKFIDDNKVLCRIVKIHLYVMDFKKDGVLKENTTLEFITKQLQIPENTIMKNEPRYKLTSIHNDAENYSNEISESFGYLDRFNKLSEYNKKNILKPALSCLLEGDIEYFDKKGVLKDEVISTNGNRLRFHDAYSKRYKKSEIIRDVNLIASVSKKIICTYNEPIGINKVERDTLMHENREENKHVLDYSKIMLYLGINDNIIGNDLKKFRTLCNNIEKLQYLKNPNHEFNRNVIEKEEDIHLIKQQSTIINDVLKIINYDVFKLQDGTVDVVFDVSKIHQKQWYKKKTFKLLFNNFDDKDKTYKINDILKNILSTIGLKYDRYKIKNTLDLVVDIVSNDKGNKLNTCYDFYMLKESVREGFKSINENCITFDNGKQYTFDDIKFKETLHYYNDMNTKSRCLITLDDREVIDPILLMTDLREFLIANHTFTINDSFTNRCKELISMLEEYNIINGNDTSALFEIRDNFNDLKNDKFKNNGNSPVESIDLDVYNLCQNLVYEIVDDSVDKYNDKLIMDTCKDVMNDMISKICIMGF